MAALAALSFGYGDTNLSLGLAGLSTTSPSSLIVLTQPLYDDGVEYADGTKATPDQMAKDVTAFLAWASEPEMEDRKRLGISVMLFLLLLSALSYFAMKQIWAPIKKQ